MTDIIECINTITAMPLFKILILPLLLTWIITATVSKTVNESLEKLKHSNARDLQTENFYRQTSSKEINSVLNDWSEMLIKLSPDRMMEDYSDLINKTFIYGSSKTVKLLSNYQQHTYSKEDTKIDNQYGLVYIAMIACSLKKDFTNEEIDAVTMLKIKIKDIAFEEEDYKRIERAILEKINK